MKTHFSFLQHQTAILKHYQPFKNIVYLLPKKKFSATTRPALTAQYLRTAVGEMDSTANTALDSLIQRVTRPLTLHATSPTYSQINFLWDKEVTSSTSDKVSDLSFIFLLSSMCTLVSLLLSKVLPYCWNDSAYQRLFLIHMNSGSPPETFCPCKLLP